MSKIKVKLKDLGERDCIRDYVIFEGIDYLVVSYKEKPYIIEDIERHREYGYLYQGCEIDEDTKFILWEAKSVKSISYKKI